MNEFELIKKYFTRPAKNPEVILSVGDDCALVHVPENKLLATSTDTLVENSHFYPEMPATALGYKSLAISISDVLAMGAKPIAAFLSLTLPELNENWLAAFSKGFYELVEQAKVDLIGGNIAKGPLSITTTVQGTVAQNKVLKRSGAQVGDLIFVAGELGAAAGAFQLRQQNLAFEKLQQSWYQPQLRLGLIEKLNEVATAAIDLSDGLLADLQHLLTASGVGANLFSQQIPVANSLLNYFSAEQSLQLALQGGEDYQLCFTAPAAQRDFIESELICFCIGEITAVKTLLLDGKEIASSDGFQHF
jgi:thiamine-monophosphate kinase